MQRPNIYAVAKQAGVSPTTVSRVLNGNGPVASSTRARILAAIRALDYEPSWIGRALAGQKQNAIGIVFPDLAGPYHTGVIAGLEAMAAATGLALFILGTHGRDRSGAMVAGFAQHVDGLVLTAGTVDDQEVVRLRDQGIKVVLLGRAPVPGVPDVRVENHDHARRLTRHLLKDHHLRHLRFLGDPRASPDVEERWAGFLAGHAACGVRPARTPIRTTLRQQDGYRAARALLQARTPLDALVCANDELALGVYAAASELDVPIPQDLRVTGWDDIPQAAWTAPALTTVHQPLDELGKCAGEVLWTLMQGGEIEHDTVLLTSQVMIRESCGCVGV